jgi:hypothetical protein
VLEIKAIHKNLYASKFNFQPGAPVGYPLSVFQLKFLLFTSVADPDPEDGIFLGLPDLDPLVGGTDPDPISIIKQKSKKNLDSYCFVTSL